MVQLKLEPRSSDSKSHACFLPHITAHDELCSILYPLINPKLSDFLRSYIKVLAPKDKQEELTKYYMK